MVERMKHRAYHLLQPVPIKKPRTKEPRILATDDEIINFDTANFVFTDVSYNTSDQVLLAIIS